MSTYTDIKNRIKENIAANTEDREVSAKIVFVNPENVYYGAFIGDVTASALAVPDGFFDGMSLNRPVLVNPVLSSSVSSDEDGILTAKLDFGDLRAVSCAVRSIKECLASRFAGNDPVAYSAIDMASALIDLKNVLSSF